MTSSSISLLMPNLWKGETGQGPLPSCKLGPVAPSPPWYCLVAAVTISPTATPKPGAVTWGRKAG